MLSSEMVRAARALLRWEQKQLASASGVSLPTVKRLETAPGPLAAHGPTIAALRRALEAAGVEFIPENGGGAGVRLRDRREVAEIAEGPTDELSRQLTKVSDKAAQAAAAPRVNPKKPKR